MSDQTILITGFSPMGGWKQNASEIVVNSLRDEAPVELPKANIVYAIIPASVRALATQWDMLLAQYSPDICILLGQARGRSSVCLERFALNIADFNHPDADGETRFDSVIENNSPLAYRSSFQDLSGLHERLVSAGVPTSISNYAGASLCNFLYYTALHEAARSSAKRSSLFVHIPVLPAQAIEQWPDAPSMSLETLRCALTEVVQHSIEQHV